MINHLTLKVSDYQRAKQFYGAALAPLGYTVMMEFEGYAGLGAGHPDLWITADPQNLRPMHFALSAPDQAAVDAFHRAALAAGAEDNGKPGPRPDYGPNYYAAFVHDPDGHNVEAVFIATPKPAGGAKRAGAKRKAGGTAKRAAPRKGGKAGAKRRSRR
ncbi:MAG TPA: VOC family protein [Anaeromyxobacteraceae bacterium]|nr:VOC family protein [Anaeromyxobacteraceae bacterium]